MLDVLKFIFSDYYHFFGTVFLLYVIGNGVRGMFGKS